MTLQEKAQALLPILCNSCGYSGSISSYEPNLTGMADCRCPQCGSTDNEHNDSYLEMLQKAWRCKHPILVDAGKAANNMPLLKCEECGSIGLDWSMRGEKPPKP